MPESPFVNTPSSKKKAASSASAKETPSQNEVSVKESALEPSVQKEQKKKTSGNTMQLLMLFLIVCISVGFGLFNLLQNRKTEEATQNLDGDIQGITRRVNELTTRIENLELSKPEKPVVLLDDLSGESPLEGQGAGRLPIPASYQDCETPLNADSANTSRQYKNAEQGISFTVPYNESWGTADYFLHPYEEHEFGVDFGNVFTFEACSLSRMYSMNVAFPVSFEERVMELEEELSLREPPGKIEQGEVNGRKYAQYLELGLCKRSVIEVFGEKANYLFSANCSEKEEDIQALQTVVQSIQFLE